MHFWIGERASQFHHQGRWRRPPLYNSGAFFGSGFANRRDKPYGQWNRRYSPASLNQQHLHPAQQPSPSTSVSSSSHPSSSTNMVTPVHRFQTLGPTPSTIETPSRLSISRAGATSLGGSHSGGPASSEDVSPGPRPRDPTGYYHPRCQRSRSRERERRDRYDPNGSQRRRRSSSSDRRRRYRNSNILASSEVGGANSSTNSEVRDSSFSSSDTGTSDCSRTKRVGLTLCFMGLILLSTVAAKFIIEGPGIIDSSRRGPSETTAYFFLTELIFVAFAMALFFTGVACLRKRTNDYLLRQFNQHILRGTTTQRGLTDDLSNSELLYDPIIITGADNPDHTERNSIRASYPHPAHGLSAITTPIHHNCLSRHSPSHHSSFYAHHHHHHHHLGGYGTATTLSHPSRHGHLHSSHYIGSTGSRRCPYLNSSSSAAIMLQRQQPPPYHIALYLPLPSTGAPQFEIIDESGATTTARTSPSLIGRESCSLNVKDDGGSNEEGEPPPPLDKDKEEESDGGGPPETPPPSYEQFVLRI